MVIGGVDFSISSCQTANARVLSRPIPPQSANASHHTPLFSQALMAVLYVMVSASILLMHAPS